LINFFLIQGALSMVKNWSKTTKTHPPQGLQGFRFGGGERI